MEKNKKPLVYSCSGCSSAAQMANYIAINLDRAGIAEMSCIAGVGGGVKPLVKKAQSGRPILAIDGCPLKCTEQCLKNQDVQATQQMVLSEHGVKKVIHQDFDMDQAHDLLKLAKSLMPEVA